jgi:hypothetical protein
MTFDRFALTKPDRVKRDVALAKLKAITTREYADFEPLVLDAVRGIGPAVWTWLDEGPGERALTDYRANPPLDAFWRLRRVRNTNRAIFDAITEKPAKAARPRKPKA